jgi:hypothetical protein
MSEHRPTTKLITANACGYEHDPCESTFFKTPCEIVGPHTMHRAVTHLANGVHIVTWEDRAADLTYYREESA